MVAFLSADELIDLAALHETAMTELATITNFVEVSDGAGGITVSETTVGPVPAYRTPEVSGVGEAVMAGQLAQGLRWKIGLPAGTVVSEKSRIAIGSESYEVIAVAGPSTFETARICYAVRR